MRRLLISVLLLALTGLAACSKKNPPPAANPLRNAYDSEIDWNDPQRIIPLTYEQAQGKRIFYQQCVWCHADSTPAGPSNRSNVNPTPALFNDGSLLNSQSDDFLQNIITLGGSALGKSAMMPPYGKTLSQGDIRSLIAFARAIAVPPYQPASRPGPKYSEK
ncbi:MAG TPA: cytochrome c [Candidatus Limnocylindrales bacterium]|jgi:mono/diheme cytochrome c family protein|nr:cytochrome c [Candidatus Limnocylindrales bacterium]